MGVSMVVSVRVHLCFLVRIVGVGVTATDRATVRVAMLVEEEQTSNVGQQPQSPHNKNQLCVGNGRRLNHTLDSLDEDSEAKRQKEHCINKCTQNLRTEPPIGVFSISRTILGNINGPQCNN